MVTVRLKAVGLVEKPVFAPLPEGDADAQEAVVDQRPVVFDGERLETPCYVRERLRPGGHRFAGPALVFQMDATTVVSPGWGVWVDGWGNLMVEKKGQRH